MYGQVLHDLLIKLCDYHFGRVKGLDDSEHKVLISAWFDFVLCHHVKAYRTPIVTKSLLSLTVDEQRILDQQSLYNELGKHHSSHNLKNSYVCLFVWRLQSDRDISSPVSSVRWKRHLRPSLAIAWIPTNCWCDIQTVTDGYKMKGALLCFAWNDSSFSPGPPNWCPLCGATYLGFLWPSVLPPLALSSRMAPKTKEPSSTWYGSPSAPSPPGT